MKAVSEKERIIYYDFIRAFAIFGVIACHCFSTAVIDTEIFATPFWYYAIALNSLRDFCVPLFVCISGALLIEKHDSVVGFVKKRFSRVLVPYIFWTIIFIATWLFILPQDSWSGFVLNVFSIPPAGPATFFWFVQMILAVYVFILILNQLIKRNPVFLRIALLLSIILIVLLNLNIIPDSSPALRYIYYSAFAVFGFYLSRYDFTCERLSDSSLSAIFLVLSVVLYIIQLHLIAAGSIISNHYVYVSQFSFLNVFLVFAVFLFFRYAFKSRETIEDTKLGRFVLSVSLFSYGMYLCHMIVRNGLLDISGLKNIFPNSVYLTFILMLTFLISWMVILVTGKVPVLKRLVGI